MPRGRRRGRSGTRAGILAAARRHFAEDGYERATLRDIARTAHVDPRLVSHFYGSKHDVFVAAMELPVDPSEFVAAVTAPGIDGLGERLARLFVTLWDSREGRHLVALMRSVVSHDDAATMMREVFVRLVLRQLVQRLDIDRPERRASFVASQLFGLAFVRYVLKLKQVAVMSPEEIARWVGPTLQRYFVDDVSDSVERSVPATENRGGRRAAASRKAGEAKQSRR